MRLRETQSLTCSILLTFLHVGCGLAVLPSQNVSTEETVRQRGELSHQLESARAHYTARQYAQAESELEALQPTFPDSFELNEMLGLVYSTQGRHDKASRCFQKAMELQPNSSRAHGLLAASLLRLGRDSQASREFHRAVELDPGGYQTNRDLGEFCLRQGELRRAIPYLRKAQDSNPSSYDNGYNLALAYVQTGDVSAARKLIKALLQVKETAELHSLLGEAEEKAGDPARATKEFARAAQMDPSEDNLINLGIEFARHRALGLALKVFKEGADLYPHSARMQVGLGSCHYLREEYSLAIKAFIHATEVDPSNPNVYLVLAKAYTTAFGMRSEAVAERLEKWVQLRPNDPLASYYCALSLRKEAREQGRPPDPAKVGPLLQTAIRRDPRMAGAYLQLGILVFEADRYAEAIRMYERAIKIQPDLSEAHYRLGQALARTGEKARAQQESELYGRLLKKEEQEKAKQDSEMLQLVYSTEASSGSGHSGIASK